MNQNAKKIIKISSVSFFFIIIIIYAFFTSKELIFGIKIKNVNLVDNSVMTENIVKVTGNAKNAIKLTLNDREISVDQKGNFEETISLLLGYNIITIKAKDKFGNSDEKNYKLIYKAEVNPAQ
ncbi:MAG: hypothetical protein WA101_03435 [Minisyncoccia bacterium]